MKCIAEPESKYSDQATLNISLNVSSESRGVCFISSDLPKIPKCINKI